MSPSLRFPAEWEPQSAVLLAWPHAGTDWAERLGEVEETFIALAAAITRFEPVVLCVGDDDIEAYARARLSSARVDMDRVRFVVVPYNDTWLRDTGPITLVPAGPDAPHPPLRGPFSPQGGDKGTVLLDFRFTGWGGKFEAAEDDQLVERLSGMGIFSNSATQSIDFSLEGGAIDTDGQGSLLSTWRCLAERHPGSDPETVGRQLAAWLHQDRVLWLHHGYLEGDDTDAHVDTLARFAAPDAIVFQACDDPDDGHYAELRAMAGEIEALRTTDGRPYRLFPLPWPRPIRDRDGERRLAASYANFLIVNGAVLVPAYGDPADAPAAAVLAEAFPGREIVQVPCRALIWQNGSLHCLTMQLPAGIMAG